MSVTNRLPEHVFIIGAGIAGLSCAEALQAHGVANEIFEKRAVVGGRVNTKSHSDWRCDDGAQYFTAKDPAFLRATTKWLQQGIIALWEPRLSVIEGDPVSIRAKPSANNKRYVGVPSMGALPHCLAAGHKLHLNSTIDQLRRTQLGWQAHSKERGWSENHAQALVLALPPAQSLMLLQDTPGSISSKLATFSMRPTWALMLRMPDNFDPGFDAAFVNVGPLRWLAKDSSKPGRAPNNIWLAHASGQWSELNIERSVDEVGKILNAEFESLTGGAALEAALHLWRNADTENAADNGCFWDAGMSLGVCGDWLAQGRVEGAWKSGYELANKMCFISTTESLDVEFSEVEFATQAYCDALELRESVLRKPLGRSLDIDDLEGEDKQFHFAYFNKRGEVVATISAKDLGEKVIKLRQMAVHEAFRGKGIGAMLLQKVETVFKAKGFKFSQLHARKKAQGFYQKNGYQRVGDVFQEVGVAHLKMTKKIS